MSAKPVSWRRAAGGTRVLPALSLPLQHTGSQGLGSVEKLDGRALACSLSRPGITARLPVHSLPGGRDSQERPPSVEPGSHPTSYGAPARRLPDPRRPGPWLQGVTGAPGPGARQGWRRGSRLRSRSLSPGPHWAATGCLSRPLRQEGRAEIALEDRATLRPH